MNPDAGQGSGQSSEYREQQIIEAIALDRYPRRTIKEILPGFAAGPRNYVWLVLLNETEPFQNTVTTVDTNDILAWQARQRGGLE